MINIINSLILDENEKCKAIQTLVSQDSSVLTKTTLGLTPLHVAVMNRLPKVIMLLIKLGMSVDAVNYNKQTPLHYAAENGMHELIFLLGYSKCNFNLVDDMKESALHKAVINKHPACVKNLLLASNFTMNKTLCNNEGLTAEDILRKTMDLKLQLALAEAITTPPDLFKRTPLHLAVINNAPDIVRLHLELGAFINVEDCDGRTALHLAALCGHAPILLMLSHYHEVDMNKPDKDGNTALHLSIEAGYPDCVKILVSANKPTDKNLQNKAKLTAADLIKKESNKDKVATLNKALLSMQLGNGLSEEFEREFCTFFDYHDQSHFMSYIKKHFPELDESLKTHGEEKQSPRRISAPRLLRRTRSALSKRNTVDSSSPRETPNLLEINSIIISKEKTKEYNSEEDYKKLDEAYKQKEVRDLINLIKNAQDANSLLPLKQNLKKLIQSHINENDLHLFFLVFSELHPIMLTEKKDFEYKCSQLRVGLRKQLLADGLKKICSSKEINNVTAAELSHITDYEIIVKHLQALIEICSGEEINNGDVIIEFNTVIIKILGLMDFVTPDEIVSLLIKLNPFFSNIQCLLSHFIIFTLMEIHEFYGYVEKNSPFAQQVDLYFQKCCGKVVSSYISDYQKTALIFKTSSIHSLIEELRLFLVKVYEPPCDRIIDKINEFVNQGSIKSKVPGQVEYIANEFNIINAKFYQNCSLQEFRQKCWDIHDKNQSHAALLEYSELINRMSIFVKKIICSYSTPQKQAHSMTLFIRVAQQCLYYQYGADFISLFAIVLALKSKEVSAIKDNITPFLEKEILKIKDSLFHLTHFENNFISYRRLLSENQHIFPFMAIIFSDKIHMYDNDLHININFLGKLYQPLILIKKTLNGVPLDPRSDLLKELIQENYLEYDEIVKKNDGAEKTSSSEKLEPSPRKSKRLSLFSSNSINSKSQMEPSVLQTRGESVQDDPFMEKLSFVSKS